MSSRVSTMLAPLPSTRLVTCLNPALLLVFYILYHIVISYIPYLVNIILFKFVKLMTAMISNGCLFIRRVRSQAKATFCFVFLGIFVWYSQLFGDWVWFS